MKRTVTVRSYGFYRMILDNSYHILIAGATRSGKSTIINGLIYTAMQNEVKPTFFLIDPKRVDLRKFRNSRLVVSRVTETKDAILMLNAVIDLMEARYKKMEINDQVVSSENDVYVVIDEVADLMLTAGNEVTPLIQRIAQLGAAAKIHLIMATQTVLAKILSTPIKNNFDCIIGLRTATANQSRVIIGMSGCERLPKYGEAIIYTGIDIKRYKVPMVDENDMKILIDFFDRG